MSDVGEEVTIRTSDGELTVRGTVLSNCSNVLEGILRDGAGPRVIAMDEFSSSAVESFLDYEEDGGMDAAARIEYATNESFCP